MIKACLVILLLWIGGSISASAQQKDTSDAELRKEAQEIKDQLNRYINNSNIDRMPAGNQLIDSLKHVLGKQQAQLYELAARFDALDKAIKSGKLVEDIYSNLDYIRKNAKAGDIMRNGETEVYLFFSNDHAELTTSQVETLQKIATSQNAQNITINGFSDWEGNDLHNQKLSSKRCKNVMDILKSNATLTSHTYTRTKKDTPAKKQWYRRVEVVFENEGLLYRH